MSKKTKKNKRARNKRFTLVKVANKLTVGARNVLTVFTGACIGVAAYEGGKTILTNGINTYKEIKDPTVYKTKEKGLFGKRKKATKNPITGKYKSYNGKKKASNKKPIIVPKGTVNIGSSLKGMEVKL